MDRVNKLMSQMNNYDTQLQSHLAKIENKRKNMIDSGEISSSTRDSTGNIDQKNGLRRISPTDSGEIK